MEGSGAFILGMLALFAILLIAVSMLLHFVLHWGWLWALAPIWVTILLVLALLIYLGAVILPNIGPQ